MNPFWYILVIGMWVFVAFGTAVTYFERNREWVVPLIIVFVCTLILNIIVAYHYDVTVLYLAK